MAKASIYVTLGNLADKHDGKAIKRALDTLPGVRSVSISDSADCVAVDFDTTGVRSDRIQKQLEAMGYQVVASKTDDHIV